MLELLFDNRSADKPEIIVVTKNEEVRLQWLLDYYGGEFDIVILDGGSDDGTVDLARAANITAFRRGDGRTTIECYAFYVENILAKQKFHIQLSADEFVDRDFLLESCRSCTERGAILLGRRIDWLYCLKSGVDSSVLPRGSKPGQLVWKLDKLHAFVEAPDRAAVCVIDIQHFHLHSVSRRFGHLGIYTRWELDGYFRAKRPRWRSFRRFVLRNLVYMPVDIWGQWRNGPKLVILSLASRLADMAIGVMGYAELRWLKSEQEQMEFYKSFYYPGVPKAPVDASRSSPL